MSIRTYVDHNFFHHVHEWSEDDPKLTVIRSFANHRYSLYASGELVSEMIALLGTTRAGRLPAQAAMLLEVMSGRVLQYYGDLVMGELAGRPIREFLPAGQVRQLKELLTDLARGETPTIIPEVIVQTRERKNHDLEVWKGARQHFQQRLEQEAIKRPNPLPTFDQFCAKHLGELVDSFIGEGVKRGRLVTPPVTAEQVMGKLEQYPYTNAAFKAWAALLYHYWVENRGVDRSDIFDLQQVPYLTGLDLLVSDDTGMRELCGRVHGSRVRVLDREGFIKEVMAHRELEAAHIVPPR